MGYRSHILAAFWEVMEGKIPENRFLATLDLQPGIYPPEGPQQAMVEFLSTNREHFSPSRVRDDAAEQASSRVEGFFGAYTNMTHDKIVPLATAVKGIRILGRWLSYDSVAPVFRLSRQKSCRFLIKKGLAPLLP
jgi:hypothetical protein